MSERWACRMIGADRSSVRYQARCPDGAELRTRLRELAHERWRFGYRRLHALLRPKGHFVNRKRVPGGLVVVVDGPGTRSRRSAFMAPLPMVLPSSGAKERIRSDRSLVMVVARLLLPAGASCADVVYIEG